MNWNIAVDVEHLLAGTDVGAFTLAWFKLHGLDLKAALPESLHVLNLLDNFVSAPDADGRNKVVKTAIRTVLPWPLSMLAGEALAKLKCAVPLLDEAIRDGLPVFVVTAVKEAAAVVGAATKREDAVPLPHRTKVLPVEEDDVFDAGQAG